MAKSRSYKTQENATWRAFSKYIRTRDALRTTGTLSHVECFTCGDRIPTAASQAGHIVSRAYKSALFNEKVVHAQCVTCNYKFEGNHILGFMHLAEMVGWERAIEIVMDSIKPRSLSMHEMEDIEEGCEAAVEIMEEYYEEHAK